MIIFNRVILKKFSKGSIRCNELHANLLGAIFNKIMVDGDVGPTLNQNLQFRKAYKAMKKAFTCPKKLDRPIFRHALSELLSETHSDEYMGGYKFTKGDDDYDNSIKFISKDLLNKSIFNCKLGSNMFSIDTAPSMRKFGAYHYGTVNFNFKSEYADSLPCRIKYVNQYGYKVELLDDDQLRDLYANNLEAFCDIGISFYGRISHARLGEYSPLSETEQFSTINYIYQLGKLIFKDKECV